MPKCSSCSKVEEAFKGMIVVDSITGNMRYFCSSKCRKNFEMQRKKRKWNAPKKSAEAK